MMKHDEGGVAPNSAAAETTVGMVLCDFGMS